MLLHYRMKLPKYIARWAAIQHRKLLGNVNVERYQVEGIIIWILLMGGVVHNELIDCSVFFGLFFFIIGHS